MLVDPLFGILAIVAYFWISLNVSETKIEKNTIKEHFITNLIIHMETMYRVKQTKNNNNNESFEEENHKQTKK